MSKQENTKKIYYNIKTKEWIFRRSNFRYLTLKINKLHWAIPFRIQKAKWGLDNSTIDWHFQFLCFEFYTNRYGALVRDKEFPWKY